MTFVRQEFQEIKQFLSELIKFKKNYLKLIK